MTVNQACLFYANVVDMFPPTDSAKTQWICFQERTCSNDIYSVLSTHVECVTLMSRVEK